MITKHLLLIALALAFSGVLFGQFTGDGGKQTVLSSKHDLRTTFSATAVCEFCHVPHKLGTSPASKPPLLWNVTLKTGSFSPYGGSSTFDGSGSIRDVATASSTNNAAYYSLLCLSCHDGTITQASFYQVTSGMGGSASVTPPNVGNSGGNGLADDHPVDFTFSAALAAADGGLRTPTEGAGVAIPYVGATTSLPLFKDQGTDVSGRMECATCHNPHNAGSGKFLRMANSGSALCLNCHGL